MKPPPQTTTPEQLRKIIAQAIANGTHCPIEKWRTVCDGCRQWVGAIYHVTTDHKRLCQHCYEGKSGPISTTRPDLVHSKISEGF